MKKIKTIANGLVVAVLCVVLFVGLNHLFFHFSFGSTEQHTTLAASGPSEVTRIEPIVLDCRARVTVQVPVRGTKYYRVTLLGFTKTYRNDDVWLTAIGDVDVCVRDGANVQQLKDNSWLVTIPAGAVVFERPRIDQSATLNSVGYDKGWFGKLTDSMPWVADSSHLVPAAFMFAQGLIAGSNCMSVAWTPVASAIKSAYRQQAVTKHLSPNRVTVIFDGIPDFRQHDSDLKSLKLKNYTLKADMKKLRCLVRPNALTTNRR